MRRNVKLAWLGSLIILAAVTTGRAQGTSILTPVSVSASSYYGTGYASWRMIDGTGLTGTGRTATHTNLNAVNLFWHSSGVAVSNEWVEFDLGGAYDVTNALIWQLAQSGNTTRGVQRFTISVAREDHVFLALSTTNLNIATGSVNEPVQVRPLVATEIRYVRFTILSNYGNAYVGLSEVRFEGAESVSVPLITPVVATASSNYGPQPYLYGPQFMIDGSGLTGSGGRWSTHSNLDRTNLFWHSNTPVDVSKQWVEFDLGATYRVTNAVIWQLAQVGMTGRGTKAFTISVADRDHNFSTFSTNNLLNIATGSANEPAQIVPLVASNVRYIKFNIEANWGIPSIVGLSEVRFTGDPMSPPTPRDLTWNGTSGNAFWNKAAQNWITNTSATAFQTGDNVRFDDTAAEKIVTLTNNVIVGSLVVDNTGTYRISAGVVADNRILEADSFVKRGSGMLELGGGLSGIPNSSHTFTGGLFIAEGTVKVISHGQNTKNATEGVLGNMQAARIIRVSTNATLNLAGSYLSGRLDSIPLTALVVDHGTLSFSATNNSENALGPLTLDSAKIECVNTQAQTHVALNGVTRIMGTSTVHFAQTGLAKTLYFLAPSGTELCVSNITQDATWDARVDWYISDSAYTNSSFRKTGAGTLYLGNPYNAFTGDIRIEDGQIQLAQGDGNMTPQGNSLLGLCMVPHTVSVFTNTVLEFLGNNTIASGLREPKMKVAVIGGTLKMAALTSNCFGPMDIADATFDYTTSYSSSWPVMIFNGLTRFFGSTPVSFKSGASFATGFGSNSVFAVSDITASPDSDVTFASPFITIGQVGVFTTSQFRKTGSGTLRLTADNSATGVLTVAEGVLRIDGKWNQSNSRIETTGGWLSGTGTVRQVVFKGGGMTGTQGQTAKLTITTAEFGESGNILLYPGTASLENLKVNLATVQSASGAANLKKWTVTAYGFPANVNLSAELRNGIIIAGWNPPGTRIILR